MARKKEKFYDVQKLPLPIRPGDTVYFVLEDGSIEEDKADAVGINEKGQLLVGCQNDEYEVGTLDCLFLSREDAEKFIGGWRPDDQYGIVDYKSLDLPYKPETTFYFCDYDMFTRRWEIFREFYTIVMFTKEGEVTVRDEESICTVIGKEVDPCFRSLRKAQEYVRSNSQ